MPAFDMCADVTGAYLSSMVVAIHCRRCKRSDPVTGVVHEGLVFWRHREHLGDVHVDLFIRDRDTKRVSELRLYLLPLEIQVLSMN